MCVGGQSAEEKAANLMIVVDSSSSMSELTEDGSTRLDAVKKGLSSLVGKLPAKINAGLMVFGHRGKQLGDKDIEVVVPLGPLDPETIRQALSRLKPKGVTPLAASLNMAAEQLAGRKGRSCILIVTDGKETCGGNPVETARMIKQKYKMGIVIDIVGLNVVAIAREQLTAIAQAGGGGYHDVESSPGMLLVLPRLMEKRTGVILPVKMTKAEKKKEGAAEAKDGRKIVGGDGLGVLIVRYSVFRPKSLKILEQETGKETSGGHMWAHLKSSYKTYLRAGIYTLRVEASQGYGDMKIKNVVIKAGKETVVRLR